MESILEPWPLVLDLKSQSGSRQVAVSSMEHMNITITPVQLLSVGDALSYYKELQSKLQGIWGAPTKPLQIVSRCASTAREVRLSVLALFGVGHHVIGASKFEILHMKETFLAHQACQSEAQLRYGPNSIQACGFV
jgi:hypothetical protein